MLFQGGGGVEFIRGKSCGSGFNSNGNYFDYGLPNDTEEFGQAY